MGLIDWFQNKSNLAEADRLRVALDECLKNGEGDESILQKYAKQAGSQLGHTLTSKETDILKMLFLRGESKNERAWFYQIASRRSAS